MKRRVINFLIIVIAVSSVGMFGGCPQWDDYPPERNYRYADGWRYFFCGNNNVTLVSVMDAVGVANEDGVIVIPTELNGFSVTQLGDSDGWWASEPAPFSTGAARVNRIVIPEGIFVANTFWQRLIVADYVEFLSEEPDVSRLWGDFNGGRITIIVPDGSIERYAAAFEANTARVVIVERSAVWRYTEINKDSIRLEGVLDLKAVVNGDGVLTIPYEINGRTVAELGSIFPTGGNSAGNWSNRYFYRGLRRVNLIIIPEGVYVLEGFWRGLILTDYVEFLDDSPIFNRLGSHFDIERIRIFVPYGRGSIYFEGLGRPWGINMAERDREDSANGNG